MPIPDGEAQEAPKKEDVDLIVAELADANPSLTEAQLEQIAANLMMSKADSVHNVDGINKDAGRRKKERKETDGEERTEEGRKMKEGRDGGRTEENGWARGEDGGRRGRRGTNLWCLSQASSVYRTPGGGGGDGCRRPPRP